MQNLLVNIKTYFSKALQEKIEIINKENENIRLDKIKSFEIGYKDIAQGLRNYPTFFIYNNGRTMDGYYTNEHIVIRLVLTNENMSTLEMQGYLYMDAIERAIRNDKSLGGSLLYPTEANITSVILGITYVINVEFDAVIDRGVWENGNE